MKNKSISIEEMKKLEEQNLVSEKRPRGEILDKTVEFLKKRNRFVTRPEIAEKLKIKNSESFRSLLCWYSNKGYIERRLDRRDNTTYYGPPKHEEGGKAI